MVTTNTKRLSRKALAELAAANPNLVAIARANGTVRAFCVDVTDPIALAEALEAFFACDDCQPRFISAAEIVAEATGGAQ